MKITQDPLITQQELIKANKQLRLANNIINGYMEKISNITADDEIKDRTFTYREFWQALREIQSELI
jgi:hypothetical protein